MATALPSDPARARSERLLRRALVASAPLLGIAAAGLLALEDRGSFDGTVLVLVLAIVLGGPALLLGGACLLLRILWRHRLLEDAASLGIAAALFFAATLPSVPVGRAIGEGDRAAVRAYARRLVSLLEEERSARGGYPAAIPDLPGRLGPPPRLLRDGDWFYERRGEGFEFGYRDPSRMTGGALFDSASGRWRRWG